MSSIFFLGATGYIGGGFTAALRKYRPDLKITALHRSPSHESILRDFGVMPVQGTLQELEKIEGYSYESDIVINAASSFDLELTNAILRGMKRRFEEGKAKGVLIHVTGVASFVDGSLTGSYVDGKVWNDNNEDDIRGIKPVWSGAVDAAILKAGEEGYFDSWLICAGGVHGTSNGPIRKTGAKYVLNPALQNKYVFYIGEGSNLHPEVHIDDLVALFHIVFKKAIAGSATGSTYGRFYMGSTRLTSMKSIATALGAALFQRGKVDQPEPKSLTVHETGRIGAMLACNMLVESDRSLEEGWKPEGVTLEETLMKDMDEMLEGTV